MNGSFDSKEFRQVLGHFPTGVVIISGLDGAGGGSRDERHTDALARSPDRAGAG